MKLKYTKLQLIAELLGLVLLIVMVLFVVVQWNELPQTIPGHYNAAGVVDRWGSKSEILTLPIVAVFLYILLTTTSFFPNIWNIPVKLTEKNKVAVYQSMKTLLILIKIEMAGVFFFITYNVASAKNLPPVFLPISIIIIFGTIILSIIRVLNISKKYEHKK